jgi:hypothetical protein
MKKNRTLRPGRAAAMASDEEDRKALHPLAAEIRLAYIRAFRVHYQARHGVPSNYGSRLIPRWDGGEDASGVMRRPIWYRIARVAQQHQASPEDLIEATFRGWESKDPPLPTNLISAETLARVAADPGVTAEITARALSVQQSTWKTETYMIVRREGCDFNAAARKVLKNCRVELSSIFRYCIASEVADEEIAAMFESGAVKQYIYNRRAYDRGWGDVIPPRLRLIADRLNIA